MLSATPKEEGCCANDKCAEIAQMAGQRLREVVDSTADEARDLTAGVIKQVRQHPVQSNIIAAAVGLVAGLLLNRR